jgi:AcrR family transcriptional regulator
LPRKIRTHSEDKELVQERRKYIVKNSIRTFVKKGYARTNVEDLLKASKMGRGTFYHYLGSKEDIVYLIVQYTEASTKKLMEEIVEKCENMSPKEALTEAIDRYYRYCDETQDGIMFGMRETVYLPAKDRQFLLDNMTSEIDVFEKLLIKGIESGEFEISQPRLLAFDILSRALTWATGRWFLRKQVTIDEYIKYNTDCFFKIIRKDKSCADEASVNSLLTACPSVK